MTSREVFANGVSEGSSELALTVDEERSERSEHRKRLGRCEAVAVRGGAVAVLAD